jgi:hypothetical protein
MGKSKRYVILRKPDIVLSRTGVVSSNIYRTKDSPRFFLGHGVVLAYLVIFLFGGSIVTHLLLRAENRKRQNGQRNYLTEGKTPEQLEVLGDKR